MSTITLDAAVLDSFHNPAWRTEKRKKARTAKQANRLSFSNQAIDYDILRIHRLRCNVKSLAAESRIIRKEEKRAGIQYESVLRDHRIRDLRTESRYAQLALAFVRGKKYVETERGARLGVDVTRLSKKLSKFYFANDLAAKVAIWVAGV